MKKSLTLIIVTALTVFSAPGMAPPGGSGGGSSFMGILFFLLIIILIVVGIIVLIAKASRLEDNTEVTSAQMNKVVNVTVTGGLIGLFGGSPRNSLNNRISRENANGWTVIQIIPADSGNILLLIFRWLLLILTFFLFTTANGYYVIMERIQLGKQTDNKFY